MMRPLTPPTRLARTSCSILALATVLVVGASPAAAQSFLGNGTVTSGTGTITTGVNTTNISVATPQTVIDWTPFDNAIANNTTIAFQNSGTTATFSGSGNYAVLNRINPADSTRSITMNGLIQTVSAGAATSANGSIYFYSPGGFVLGANSVINVGSLVLSASPITVNGSGNFINGVENTVIFGQATNPLARILTTAGSQINASASDAYVAMVAPRVEHRGLINVSGSAALVGAEAATINFSPSGLFDIQVTTGTTDANGVVVVGNITGSAGSGASNAHRAYLVAVPKNAALTMLIANGSSLGFDIAGVADVVGNTVVLSAGYNITGGSIQNAPAAAGNGFKANLDIRGTYMSSALVAAASGNADIFSPLGQSSSFASNVTMRGVDRASVGASGFTTTVNIAGNLDLSAAINATANGQDVVGGLVEVYALQNASVSVTGSTMLNTNASGGGSSTDNLSGGDAVGGDVNVTAQTGGDVLLNGGLFVTANGYGGYGAALNAPGGNATGGDVIVSASGGDSSIFVTGNMSIAADGLAGSGSGLECFTCDGDGGIGTGGTIDVRALAGGTLTMVGEGISLSTNGVGGYSGLSDGGNAFGGGLTRIYADGVGSVVTSSGATTITSNATGGSANVGTGGTVEGGDIDIFAQNGGNVLFDNSLSAAANGTGGAGATGGGDAFGGSVTIFSSASLQVDGALNASANATGGYLYSTALDGNSAGDGFGGGVDVYAQNGTLTLVDAVYLSTNAVGGQVGNSLGLSGDGVGGTTRLFANASGVIDLQSTLNATAIGSGGGSDYYSSGIGGDGLGGAVRVQATAADASITIAGAAILDASGEGSGSSGGNGTGGTAYADSFGAATASLNFLSDVTLYAQGVGGDHNNGNGGNGQGGEALLQASAGSTLSVGGDAIVNTDAFGGYSYDFSDGVGGNAIGGVSRIQAFGAGSITVDGSATISASGNGGDSYSFLGGTAGDGTGGNAHLITTLGNITIGAPESGAGVDVSADGYGGYSTNGTGGDGTGGAFARLEAINGDITIDGFAAVSASGTGGDGLYGGNGLGSGDTSAPNTADWTGGAHIFAMNGDIVINGGAGVSSTGTGGDGGSGFGYGGDYGGDGGNGTGGWASIHAANSGLGPSSISIISGNLGSSGFASVITDGTGGAGGDGYDGNFGNYGGDGIPGTVGTDGGNGTSGEAGGAGGRGGNGVGGVSVITASSDNGQIDITSASASAVAIGGAGGDGAAGGNGGSGGNGGNGLDGSGGNGGNGGNGGAGGLGGAGGAAIGGGVNIGTQSGNAQAFGLGQGGATYGSIILNASAIGGQGGDGGNGGAAGFAGAAGSGTPGGIAGNQGSSGVAGNGGAGGDATGGAAVLQVRGSTVTVGSATLSGDAIGGDGGDGAFNEINVPGIDGSGGNATVGGGGGIGVLVTGRFQLATQRGTLDAGSIIGTASAIGGSGSIFGSSETLGGSTVSFLNSDGSIGSLDFLIQAGGIGTGAIEDSISIIDGDVIVDGEFSFVTSGNLSLFANNGDMRSGILTLSAGNFVFDPVNDPPSDRGTYFADSATITTGDNFVTSANLDIGGNLSIVAPGLINAQQFTIGGNLNLSAQSGGITATVLDVNGRADLNAAGAILISSALTGFFDADAGGSFTSGNITSDTNIQIDSGGNMTIGNLLAGLNVDLGTDSAVDLESDGSILMGNVTALGGIDFGADGSVTGGNLTSGLFVFGDAEGAVTLGNISGGLVMPQGVGDEGFSVGITSATSITTGNVAGAYAVGFATLGAITTGTINAGTDFLVMATGNMSFGPITALGRVYLADSSMFIDAGGGGDNDDFDPDLVFGATPVASDGSIVINGLISAGSLQAAAGTSFSSGNIGANGLIAITAGTSIGTGSITNTGNTGLAAGTSINVGAINSGTGAVSLIAGTSYISGQTVAAGSIYADSGSDMFLGNLTASGDIELVAASDILVGNATAGETIDLDAGGYIDGGNMTAGDSVYASAGGSIDLLNISAGIVNKSDGYDADYNVGLLAGTTIDTGNINALNSIGVAAEGNIDTGNINAGDIFLALGGGNMNFGSVTTGTSGQVYLANFSMMALGGEVTNNFDPLLILDENPLASGGSITINGPVTTGLFRASAGTSFLSGNITSGTNIQIDSGANMTLSDLIAGLSIDEQSNKAVRLNSGGSIVMGNVTAKDGIDFDADGSVTGENLTSGVFVGGSAVGAIILESLSGGLIDPQGLNDGGFSVGLSSGTSISVGSVEALQSVGFASVGTLATGDIDAGGDVLAMTGGNMQFGTITANGRVYLAGYSMFLAAGGDVDGDDFESNLVFNATPVASGGSITAGTINAGSVQAAAGTTLNAGAIVASGRVALSSGGAMQTQAVTAGTSLRLTSGATINGGNLTAGTLVRVSAAGAVNVGDITIANNIDGAAPDGGPLFDTVTGPPVEVFGASIATGNIATPGYVGLYTPGSLTVGTINAGHDVIALVGANAAFGAIKTPERFFLGGYSMFALANGGESFNPALVFGAPKAKTGGTASFAGASTAASFQAHVGTDTTLQSLQTSGSALIDTGGMFTLNGTMGGNSRVISNDIALGTASAINGEIHLTSRNATQTLIGDGLDTFGQGYRLSDAEADRINGVFTIAADTAYGAAAKMIIGDLSINVAGSSGRDLEYGFGTVNGNADAPSVGSIRVVGDVTFTGLDQSDEVAFDTNLFQLDAATGSIALFSTGTTLGGTLGLYAPRVWVASGDILAKLEANSTYSGYIAELNAPAAVQRPEGVLRAASFDIDSGEEPFQSLLVQNTGTVATPAGFVFTDSDLDGDESSDDPAGSINLVINGQIITQAGTLTGIAVRDLLVASVVDTASAVPGSTINGCVLVGPCNSAPPRVDTLVATDVQLTGNTGLGDGLFGNEGDIDDGESGDGGDRSSPISPPMPLFDSRPLAQSGDVDDPVSGAGNPSLFGSPDDEDAVETCDGDNDTNCKTKVKGDGK